MCGRFSLFSPPERVAEQFELPELPGIASRYNIAPTQDAPVVRAVESNRRRLDALHWGLVPFWTDDPDDLNYSMINARAETVADNNAYRRPFRTRRCLVPADGFYEWKSTPDGKQPYWIHPGEGALFGFAGLWDRWEEEETDRAVESFTIITCDANDTVGELHDRMPVILDRSEYGDWLDPDQSNPDVLRSMLDPVPDADVQFHPVSRAVNNPTYDRPDCVEPVEG